MRAVAVIPARYASTRFPGKPLVPLLGRPMIAWVVEAASRARELSGVWVATDHEGIAGAARAAGAGVVMTSADCASGTDRVAEAARKLHPAPEIVVNLQGDEPLIEPEAIEALLAAMAESGAEMGTLARPLEPGEAERPQVVKVVTDLSGHALYFSRALIPHRREGGVSPLCRAHVGIYAFTAPFLERFARLAPGRLEGEEALEQLRALENGVRIRVADTAYRGFGIDTPEDLERARALVAASTR